MAACPAAQQHARARQHKQMRACASNWAAALPRPPAQIPSHGNAARYIERSNGCMPDGMVSGTNETCIYTPEMRRWDYFKASSLSWLRSARCACAAPPQDSPPCCAGMACTLCDSSL